MNQDAQDTEPLNDESGDGTESSVYDGDAEAVETEEPAPVSGADDESSPVEEFPPVTRAACTWLGLKVYGLGLMIPLALCVVTELAEVLYAVVFRGLPWDFGLDFRQLFLAFYLAVLPLAAFGAIMGFETYRVVAGSRKPVRLHGGFWVVLCILGLYWGVTFWAVIPLYLHSRLRRVALFGERKLELVPSVLHLVYMVAWFVALLVGTGMLRSGMRVGRDVGALTEPLVICAWSVVWACDYVLLMTFAAWRSVRILAQPKSHTLQYSLGIMLGVVLAVGVWVSGLVHIFGR